MLTQTNSFRNPFELIDEMIGDVEVNVVNKFAQRYAEVKQDLQDGWNDPILHDRLHYFGTSTPTKDEDGYLPSQLELQKRKEIRSLEYSLRSSGAERFLQRLNGATQSLSAEEFLKYCEGQPELKELTLKKELTRMQYTLYTPDGIKLTDSKEIASYIENESSELSQQHELLYRASNQTIFADIIVALTSFNGLIRPQLSAGTFVNDSSLILDLSSSQPHVRGECFLNVSIPDGHNSQLSLAGALIEVCLCPARNEFQAKVLYLSPCGEEPLAEQQVKDAAKSLAEIASM
ncbi:unnamed protein product [Cylindrotheca closterium]|uniref:Uncharacterized protein n=1 Tax=Cylindrotheca closterium TaxID=2856 RepID=A0AAD2PWA8_9STRA|nr:unnamed protein product [Cylindrotheca closterium]